MNSLQKGIITLIRSALLNKALPLPLDFSIEEAYPLLLKHQIFALCYEGAVICGINKNLTEMQKLFKLNFKNLIKSENQDRELKKVSSLFNENKIDYLLLKGSILKDLYPRRELRQMGDADILIRESQYKTVKKLLEAENFKQKVGSDHAYIWYNKNITLEIHKRPMSSENLEMFDYFGNGWYKAYPETEYRYKLPPEDDFIYIFAHFAKHYRLGGIGCRQVIDLWLFQKSNPNMNYGYIENEIKKLKLFDFYRNISSLISCWFEDSPENELTSLLTDFIFDSGSWGTEKNIAISKSAILKQKNESFIKTKLKRFLKLLFPALTSLKGRYRVLENLPFLLPVIWIIRWGDILKNRPKNIAHRIKETNLVTADNLEFFENFMHKSGL